MTRWLSLVVGVTALATAPGCNNLKCGPGTVQTTVSGGKVECTPVEQQGPNVPCDLDGGAQIIGGECVTAVTCGDGTTLVNGVCQPTGGGGTAEPPPCGSVDPTNICIHGLIYDFETNQLTTAPQLTVYYYDPLVFVTGSVTQVTQRQKLSPGATGYVFNNVPTPPENLLAIVVGDDDVDVSGGNAGKTYIAAATGAQGVTSGNTYRVDAYVLKRSTADGWKSAHPTGSDYYTTGGYVARFFNSMQPINSSLKVTDDINPVAGVSLYSANTHGADPNARYFGGDLLTVDKTATTTSAATGTAITLPPSGGIDSYSGTGGMSGSSTISWETQMGGSAPHVIFITRFHPNP